MVPTHMLMKNKSKNCKGAFSGANIIREISIFTDGFKESKEPISLGNNSSYLHSESHCTKVFAVY